LQVRYPDSTFARVCDANAGPYRVVADTSALAFSVMRESGQFYLWKGDNVVVLNHYLLIQNEYPQFLNPPGQPITGSSPESVHIFRFVFVYLGACTLPCDVSLEKRADRDTVLAGETVQYHLILQNHGPNTARLIRVTELLPAELTNFLFSPPVDSLRNSVAFWGVDSLEAGQTASFSVSGTVADSLADSVVTVANMAVVRCFNDTSAANDTARVTVVAEEPPVPPAVCDVVMAKEADRDSVVAGGRVVYTLVVRNVGPQVARQVVVVDSLPGQVTAGEFSRAPEEVVGRRLLWRWDSLGVGEEVRVSFVAVVDSPLVGAPMRLVNVAVAHALGDGNPENGADSTSVVAQELPAPFAPADLSLVKTANVDSIRPGGELTYTLTVRNVGSGPSPEGRLEDVLPDQVTWLRSSVAPDSVIGRRLIWLVPPLAPGQTYDVILEVLVNAALPPGTEQMENSAFVSAPNDTNAANDHATATVIVAPEQPAVERCDLRIHKLASRDTVAVGQTFLYQILVENMGPGDAQAVVLTDMLPSGLSVESFSPQPDSVAGNVAMWRFARLGVGEQRKVLLEVRVAELPEEYPKELVNVCTVSAEGDTNVANNTSRASVVVSEVVADCNTFYFDQNLFMPEGGTCLTIFFGLKKQAEVTLDLYDITGYHVTQIAKAVFQPGVNSCTWDGKTEGGEKVGSGVYVIALRTENLICWKKVVVLR
jgi:uncharacterized repeat protein (TIGR01451 family)